MSEQEIELIEKFGFRIVGAKAVHKKMGIEKELDYFQGFSNLGDLESHVKNLLRET